MVEQNEELAKRITCRSCSMTSHHPEDVAHRCCGNCHVFHPDVNVPNFVLGGYEFNPEGIA